MKFIILENDKEHYLPIFTEYVLNIFSQQGHEAIKVQDKLTADHAIREQAPEYVLIHHHGFDDINFLSQRHARPKYIAYHGEWINMLDSGKGTIGEIFVNKMKSHYKKVFGNIGNLEQFLNNLKI